MIDMLAIKINFSTESQQEVFMKKTIPSTVDIKKINNNDYYI